MDLAKQIQKIIKGDVAADRKTLADFSHDASIFKVVPQVVVFPKDAEDIKNLVKFVEKSKEKG
jgi:FAD/FMN-containing dehydrogenase